MKLASICAWNCNLKVKKIIGLGYIQNKELYNNFLGIYCIHYTVWWIYTSGNHTFALAGHIVNAHAMRWLMSACISSFHCDSSSFHCPVTTSW